ncbi:hypothetical protein PRUPE_2G035900 [Prunus persica]|uniref:Large ribosomal subunit protein uL4m n=1 Tax=Prunus persica TaxID=3760 RepID=A0A251QAH7_PRUPE|nr:hypothetical protein PRUPE_2G035900 [Prunus persica]
MALSVSRRLLRSFGSVLASGRCDSPSSLYPSLHASLGVVSSEEFSAVSKAGSSFLANRRLSTSIPSPESSGGAFPSNLLSAKPVVASESNIGLYQDLVIPVTNFHNEDKGFTVLAGDVFDVPIRKDIIHRVVLWQLAKRQQGTHSTKTISEVSGTGRKPWNQKGTGRARQGSLRSPQFRGGSTMHGPKPRSHAFKLNKKVRRLGLKIALTARAAEGKGLNVYSILQHDTLVMSRTAVNEIVERMHTPIKR